MATAERIATRARATCLVAAVAVTSLSCGDKINPNAVAPIISQPSSSALPRHVIGVAELTFRNIGSTTMSSSIRLFTSIADLERLRSTATSGGNLDTIQLEPAATSTFTFLPPDAPPTRFVIATFGLRNRVSGGVFDPTRENVSFVAVRTSNTIANTAIRLLQRADGSAAGDSLAQRIVPTELSAVNDEGELVDVESDVLKTLSVDEARKTAVPAGAAGLLLYSFVVHRLSDASTSQRPFDGVVSFAYRLPIQRIAADNPTIFSVLFLIVDDTTAPRTP